MFNLQYVKTMTIDLISHSGDADLFVSTDPNNTAPHLGDYSYESRKKHIYDRV